MNAVMKRFAADYGMPDDRVVMVVRVADRCALYNEHECNGDPHDDNPNPADKNENARLWGAALGRAAKRLADMVKPYGLRVEFTGLRPCLRDAAGRYVEIPHRGE